MGSAARREPEEQPGSVTGPTKPRNGIRARLSRLLHRHDSVSSTPGIPQSPVHGPGHSPRAAKLRTKGLRTIPTSPREVHGHFTSLHRAGDRDAGASSPPADEAHTGAAPKHMAPLAHAAAAAAMVSHQLSLLGFGSDSDRGAGEGTGGPGGATPAASGEEEAMESGGSESAGSSNSSGTRGVLSHRPKHQLHHQRRPGVPSSPVRTPSTALSTAAAAVGSSEHTAVAGPVRGQGRSYKGAHPKAGYKKPSAHRRGPQPGQPGQRVPVQGDGGCDLAVAHRQQRQHHHHQGVIHQEGSGSGSGSGEEDSLERHEWAAAGGGMQALAGPRSAGDGGSTVRGLSGLVLPRVSSTGSSVSCSTAAGLEFELDYEAGALKGPGYPGAWAQGSASGSYLADAAGQGLDPRQQAGGTALGGVEDAHSRAQGKLESAQGLGRGRRNSIRDSASSVQVHEACSRGLQWGKELSGVIAPVGFEQVAQARASCECDAATTSSSSSTATAAACDDLHTGSSREAREASATGSTTQPMLSSSASGAPPASAASAASASEAASLSSDEEAGPSRGLRDAAADPDGFHAPLSEAAQRFVREHGRPGSTWGGEDGVRRYLRRNGHEEAVALERMKATLDWRAENAMDALLWQPQPKFAQIKAAFAHGVHCRSKQGTPVWIEHIGKFRRSYSSIHKAGITDDELLQHMLFLNEHLYGVTCPGPLPGGRTIKIMDMAGAGLGDVRGAAQAFSKKLGTLQQQHYADRMQTAYVVNLPGWFGAAWKIGSALFEPAVRQRIHMVGGGKDNIRAALLEVMHEEDIPVEYGGTCTRPLHESADELALAEHVARVNAPGWDPAAAAAAAAASTAADGANAAAAAAANGGTAPSAVALPAVDAARAAAAAAPEGTQQVRGVADKAVIHADEGELEDDARGPWSHQGVCSRAAGLPGDDSRHVQQQVLASGVEGHRSGFDGVAVQPYPSPYTQGSGHDGGAGQPYPSPNAQGSGHDGVVGQPYPSPNTLGSGHDGVEGEPYTSPDTHGSAPDAQWDDACSNAGSEHSSCSYFSVEDAEW